MGLSYQKPVTYIHKEQKPLWIFIRGLYSAGKTTVLYSAKSDKFVPDTPSIGLEIEKMTFNDISMLVMDEGGRSASRALYSSYYHQMAGIVFVIDSNDRKRIDDVRNELHRMFNDERLKNKPFLILANKQDLPNAMNVGELRDKLNLDKLYVDTKWHIQPTSAIHNKGVEEGFKWLVDSMIEKTDLMKPIVETVNDAKTIQKNMKSIFNMVNFKTFFNNFIRFS